MYITIPLINKGLNAKLIGSCCGSLNNTVWVIVRHWKIWHRSNLLEVNLLQHLQPKKYLGGSDTIVGEQGPCNLRKYTIAYDIAQSLSALGSLMLIPSHSKQATIASKTGPFLMKRLSQCPLPKFQAHQGSIRQYPNHWFRSKILAQTWLNLLFQDSDKSSTTDCSSRMPLLFESQARPYDMVLQEFQLCRWSPMHLYFLE